MGLQISSLIQQLGFFPMHVKTTKNNNSNSKFKYFFDVFGSAEGKEVRVASAVLCSGEAKVERRAGPGGQKPVFAKPLSGRGPRLGRPGSGRETGPSFEISIWRPEIGRPGLIGLIGIWILKHTKNFFFFLSFFLSLLLFLFLPFSAHTNWQMVRVKVIFEFYL